MSLTEHIAWLVAESGFVLYAKLPLCEDRRAQESAVYRLIHGVYATFGSESLRYLRRRVFVNAAILTWERELIRVCAKRCSQATLSQFDAALAAAPRSLEVLQSDIDAKNPEFVGPLHTRPRDVEAWLCDADGHVLARATNTNHINKCQHAEMNLMAQMVARGERSFPAGSTLHVTLKPCRMCAALIAHMRGESFRVVAYRDDPGPMGRHDFLGDLLRLDLESRATAL